MSKVAGLRLIAVLRSSVLGNSPYAPTARQSVGAHVFGHQHSSMGGKLVRIIGIVRARFKIGMMNLDYNIGRLVQLERIAAAPA